MFTKRFRCREGAITLQRQLGDRMKDPPRRRGVCCGRGGRVGIPLDRSAQTTCTCTCRPGRCRKDGPAAGIAIAPRWPSLLCRRPAPRRGDDRRAHAAGAHLRSAGSGEADGGGARRRQDRAVPARNQNDIIDVPDEVKQLLDIKPVETIDEVLAPGAARAAPVSALRCGLGTRDRRSRRPVSDSRRRTRRSQRIGRQDGR